MQTTKIFNFKKPEYGDQARPDPFNENFDTVEEAIASFDFLCDRYGYTLNIDKSTENTVFAYAVKEGCPYEATKTVTKSVIDGMPQFRTQITIDGTVVIFVDRKTSSGWEGVVE